MARTTTRTSLYAGPLARVHSEAYSDTFKSGFTWLARQIDRAPGPAHLFDIGCGDGTWMAAARDMNIASEGIDTSAYFVNICRDKGLQVNLDSASQALIPKATNAITALGEVLSYKPAALSSVAINAFRALPKKGVFIFDVPGLDMTQDAHKSEGDNWQLEARTFVSGNSISRHITIITPEGRDEETHFQRLFSPHEVTGILSGFGFSVEILSAYGDCALLPGRFGVLACKP